MGSASLVSTPNPGELALLAAIDPDLLLVHPELTPKPAYSLGNQNVILAQDGTAASTYGALDSTLRDRNASAAFGPYIFRSSSDAVQNSKRWLMALFGKSGLFSLPGTTHGTNTVTMASTANVTMGAIAAGTGIPDQTLVTGITPNVSITLSNPVSGSAAISLTFTPPPFRSKPDEDIYDWPAVMTSYLVSVTHNSALGGIAVGVSHQRVWAHRRYIGITQTLVEEWWTPWPWPSYIFTDVGFHATPFEWDYLYDSDRVEECLHNPISLPGIIMDGSSPHPRWPGVTVPAIVVPETSNYQVWPSSLVIHHGQDPQEGGYLRRRVTAFQPSLSD